MARFTERRIFLLTPVWQLQQHSLRARDVRAAETADSVVAEEAVAARIQRDNLNTRYSGFLFGGVCNLRDNLYGCPVFIFLFG